MARETASSCTIAIVSVADSGTPSVAMIPSRIERALLVLGRVRAWSGAPSVAKGWVVSGDVEGGSESRPEVDGYCVGSRAG